MQQIQNSFKKLYFKRKLNNNSYKDALSSIRNVLSIHHEQYLFIRSLKQKIYKPCK